MPKCGRDEQNRGCHGGQCGAERMLEGAVTKGPKTGLGRGRATGTRNCTWSPKLKEPGLEHLSGIVLFTSLTML